MYMIEYILAFKNAAFKNDMDHVYWQVVIIYYLLKISFKIM